MEQHEQHIFYVLAASGWRLVFAEEQIYLEQPPVAAVNNDNKKSGRDRRWETEDGRNQPTNTLL
jgi:hypothetical protein